MRRAPYSVTIDLKVRDLGPDDLEIRCPSCRQIRIRTGYDLSLELPGDMLVIRYVIRHVCQHCSSRSGRKVRCIGFVRPHPRSGAEGGDGPSKAPRSGLRPRP